MIETTISIVSILVAIGGWVAFAYERYRIQRRRRSIIIAGLAGRPTILNLTAHPIGSSEDDWASAYAIVDAPAEVDLASPDELERSLVEIIKGLSPDVRQRLQAADPALVVAFPAPRGSAALLDPILCGICGEFVRTTWSVRAPSGGFVWVKPVDRQMVKLRSRAKLRGLPQ